jgi:ribosome maturation factor RimP
MNSTEQNILNAAQEISEKNNLFLLEVLFRGTEKNRVIEIFIDGEDNLSADDCARISREINQVIEKNELLDSAYRLDVSTHGVDRPLKYLKQYKKHINRKFEVRYKSGENKKSITGKLLKIEDDNLYFYSGREQVIKFEDIIKAKVLVSFS